MRAEPVVVDPAHRHDLGRGPGHEATLERAEFTGLDAALDHPQATGTGEVEDGPAGQPVEDALAALDAFNAKHAAMAVAAKSEAAPEAPAAPEATRQQALADRVTAARGDETHTTFAKKLGVGVPSLKKIEAGKPVRDAIQWTVTTALSRMHA